MVSDVLEDARSRILSTFPERQIYLRSGGEVTYYNLSTRLQLGFVFIVGLMFVICLVSFANFALGFTPLHNSSKEAQQVEARFTRLLADSQAKEQKARLRLVEQQESFREMAAGIEARHNALSQIVGSDTLPEIIAEPVVTFADAQVLVSPTIRDADERVARRNITVSHASLTPLPNDNTLNAIGTTQTKFLMNAETKLLDRIDHNRMVINTTDMDTETLLQQSAVGQGGPFIPLDTMDFPIADGEFQPRIMTIKARLAEAEALEAAVRAMPLAHPVANDSMQTSGFGVRRDPFTRRPTFHQGLDFISGHMAPIVATAPGTVIYSGVKGSYGRTVEIDHGHGFVTRYAHLRKAHVKRGQIVEAGDKIGGMGSTGRSTATHLHYEVLFQGRAYDPKKFLKAGLYVQ
ncbi:M23 family metallopeptidase [Algimonas porphyrae]|uniref:Peptidase M24 n=1 Tax=Algimonas porphyrae TaxID=1128113 RepID=A0ABQ5UXD4_9PROT|nr:M23 family metallopeptidase [Algimonas porphyrae]GLQ19238.1 peptidase M24 [Algimonas porphyrae]